MRKSRKRVSRKRMSRKRVSRKRVSRKLKYLITSEDLPPAISMMTLLPDHVRSQIGATPDVYTDDRGHALVDGPKLAYAAGFKTMIRDALTNKHSRSLVERARAN